MSTITQTASVTGTQSLKTNKRVQLEVLIREFQQKLGNDWDKYHEALTMYLIGKLSRQEMVSIIGPLLKDGLFKYHNKLLLLNFANSLQDSPAEFSSELASFWNKQNSKTKSVKSTQYEKIKQNIMGLPLKERRRIRSITRESGKRNKLNAGITLTRQALLPKIPMIQDKEQQQLQVNNLVQWQQDVVNGINTPLASTLYELPDYDSLSRRVLMIMRENGLTGGVSAQVLEIISLGLESHLKTLIENAIDLVRYREHKYASNMFLQAGLKGGSKGGFLNGVEPSNGFLGSTNRKRTFEQIEESPKRTVVLNIEDLYNTLDMFPHLVEPGGPRYRLSNVMLQDDDMVPENDWGYKLPPKPASLREELPSVIPVANGAITDQGHKNALPANKTDISGDKDGADKINSDAAAVARPPNQQRDTFHIGTVDELKWVLHDLVSSL